MQDGRDLSLCQGSSERHLKVQLRGLLLSALRTQDLGLRTKIKTAPLSLKLITPQSCKFSKAKALNSLMLPWLKTPPASCLCCCLLRKKHFFCSRSIGKYYMFLVE